MTDPIRIEADYLIETAFAPEQAVEIMAGEQSSGTFHPVPGETPELKERAAARVERIAVLRTVDAPSWPGGLDYRGKASATSRPTSLCHGLWTISDHRYRT